MKIILNLEEERELLEPPYQKTSSHFLGPIIHTCFCEVFVAVADTQDQERWNVDLR